MNQIDVMKQVLIAIEELPEDLVTDACIYSMINLRQAIEQAEKQEPVEVTQTFHSNGKPKGYVLPTQPQRNHSR
jgi:hypothetical protein